MSCPRRIAVLTALETDALRPGEPLWEHVEGCPSCTAAIADAQLYALGHGAADDGELDAVALAALGLGPAPAGVDVDELAWLEALAAAPAGVVAPAPPAAPSALSRPMAMIPADEMLDPPLPTAPTPIRYRRRWPVWLGGVGSALAAAALLFTLVPALEKAGDDVIEAAPTANEPTMAAPAAATPPAERPAALEAVGGEGEAEGGGDGVPAADEKADDVKAAPDKAAPAKAAPDKAGPAKAAGGDQADEAAEQPAFDTLPAEEKPGRATARRRTARRAVAKPEPARAAATPAPARRAPSRPKKESIDDVDALLGALDGSGGGARPAASRSAGAAADGDPMVPVMLTRQQILTVVKRNARTVQGCRGEGQADSGGGEGGGTVVVSIVVAPSGEVTTADVQGAYAGTPVGACVEGAVRAFRFPQFSGEPMRFKMPFAL